jgi:hypothetical protein
MKRIIILALALIVGISTNIQAQTISRQDLRGVRHLGPGQAALSTSDFAIGVTLDGGSTYVETARLNDPVAISGLIFPEPAHMGQIANIFVVKRFGGNFQMLNKNGEYVAWNVVVGALTPFLEGQVLTPEMTVDIPPGALSEGNYLYHIGYLPPDGGLRYSDIAARLSITAQASRDEAMAMFATSISNNIVQPANGCIACHVTGGLADGLSIQKFVRTSNANHLSINFAQFESLAKARGREYVLSKVRGESAHVGGTVLVSGSADYNNLAAFLALLEKL